MEEDLKVLEEMLEREKECLHYDISQNEVQAIENLINKNKELEEEVERRIEQKVLDYKYVDKNMLRKDIIQRDYIPKSKVREKIEEYSKLQEEMTNKNHQANNINDCYKYGDNAQKAYYKKEALQELLQEGDDK